MRHGKYVWTTLHRTFIDLLAAVQILDDLDGVDTSVNAAYYSVAADYYKVSFHVICLDMWISNPTSRPKPNTLHTTSIPYYSLLA